MMMLLDLKPGDTVLEAGSGSGALTMFLSRAVGPSGRIISVDVRDDFSEIAKRNFMEAAAAGACPDMEQQIAWIVGNVGESATLEAGFQQLEAQGADGSPGSHGDLERLVRAVALDMMDPEAVLPVLQNVVHNDGMVVLYLPNITQVMSVMEAIAAQRLPFMHERTIEVSHREWKVRPPVCRPDHNTGRHTAFLVQLRRVLVDTETTAASEPHHANVTATAASAEGLGHSPPQDGPSGDTGSGGGVLAGGFWPFK